MWHFVGLRLADLPVRLCKSGFRDQQILVDGSVHDERPCYPTTSQAVGRRLLKLLLMIEKVCLIPITHAGGTQARQGDHNPEVRAHQRH